MSAEDSALIRWPLMTIACAAGLAVGAVEVVAALLRRRR